MRYPSPIKNHLTVATPLEHGLLRGGGTDDFAKPPEVGRVPVCPACIPDILPQEKGFEPKLRGLEIVDSIFTRPAQVPNGFIVHLGDVDGSKVARAHQAGQFDGVSPVGFDPIPGLSGNQGGGHDPADIAFFRQVAVEPIATRAGFIDKDEVLTFGLQPPDELIDVTLSRPDGAEGDDLGAVVFSDIRYLNRIFRTSRPT
jgi:hypothetical protein